MSETLERNTLERWRGNPTEFITEVLCDPETGKPFQLFEAQRQFFAHCWQRDGNGRALYSEQGFAAPKKSAKTTIAAMHVLTTTCLYGGRFAEAYCCANDLEQAQSRVFQQIRRIVDPPRISSVKPRSPSNASPSRIPAPPSRPLPPMLPVPPVVIR